MTQLFLTVTGAGASVQKTGSLTTGMVGVIVECSFDSAWDGLNRLAVFRCGEVIRDNALKEDKTQVPHEVLTQPGQMLYIGVEGRSREGDVVIPTVWAEAGVVLAGAQASNQPALVPTPNQFDRFMAELEQMDEKIREAVQAVPVPDWNAQPGEAGCIRNRPFGERIWLEQLLPDTVLTEFDSRASNSADLPAFEIQAGKTYLVDFNGTRYELTANGFGSNTGAYLGDMSREDPPFDICSMHSDRGLDTWINVADGISQATVAVIRKDVTIETIDPKYLPQGAGGTEGEGTQELFIVNALEDDATTPLTYYADKTVDEILTAVNSGKMPVCYYNMSGTPVVLLPVFSVDGAAIFSNTVILPDPEDGLNMHVCLVISDSGVSCFYTQIATRDDIPSAVEAALEQAKASGAFDGAPGKDGASGKDGKDGVSVTHSWNGTTLTVTSASGTSSADLKGDKGDKGDTGAQGEKGDQGDKGDKGDKGDTGATGADGAPGKDGANGKDGKDGVSVTHSWNGTTLTVTSASGTSSANLKGDKGDKGDTGAQGEKGDKGDKGDTGGTGATGFRGFSVLRITTAPSSYTTETGGFTPAYRVALSTVKSQSKATEVVVGDTVVYSYYTYPVGYVDSSYVYLGTRVSIRGSAGAAGETPEKGTDYWTEADKTEMVNATKAALPTLTVTGVDASGVSHSWTVYGVAQ